jgi:ATP-dependent RNA helicase SUPV3L1/SUV3
MSLPDAGRGARCGDNIDVDLPDWQRSEPTNKHLPNPSMSLLPWRKSAPQSPVREPAVNPSANPKTSPSAHPLDVATGGVFSAATSGERLSRVRDWLATEPAWDLMNEVFKELSHRDRGAAKPLKEKMDEVRRQRNQEQAAAEWAAKAEALLLQQRMNLADALAWQRDAARAGAPLSREPLTGLRQAIAERVKAIEDLQHQVQVEREAAVLLAQRIEILSTKSWREAQAATDALRADVALWLTQSQQLASHPQWLSVEAKFPPMLESSRQQLQLVWEAFSAALEQAVAADANPEASLPAVPVWADELRAARGEAQVAPAVDQAERDAQRAKSASELDALLGVLSRELEQGHAKAAPKAASDVRQFLKSHGRWLSQEQEGRAHALLAQAGEMEGWQRWRADQLREELVKKAETLVQAPERQRLGGRKLQEALRQLRAQWKTTDQGGNPNQALWKRFDEACNEAHKVVEAWLAQVRQQGEAHRAARLALIDEVRDWTAANASDSDWKAQIRALHAFSERWREAGHLSEKQFAELQPLWKAAMHDAHARLEAEQTASVARRKALIEEAQAIGSSSHWRIEAVKTLQQRWQAEAHGVPLDRKQEQKLWDAFRKPIDEAFSRKSAEREKAASAVSAHDQRVMAAARALDEAVASADAGRIHEARRALEEAMRAPVDAPESLSTPAGEPSAGGEAPASAPEAAAQAAPRKLVAVRGDDRPGQPRSTPSSRDERRPGRDARGTGREMQPGDRGRRESRDGRDSREPRAQGPRLGDAAFRAQRQAIEHAEAALRRLAAQAHGEVLTQLLSAWEARDPSMMPGAQVMGSRVPSSARAAWVQAMGSAPSTPAADALLRLEMAAELPTPAEHMEARRALQLQLLTRRNDPAPAETWTQDVARVLSGGHDVGSAKRLLAALKVLVRR